MKQSFPAKPCYWMVGLLAAIIGLSGLPTALAAQSLGSADAPLQIQLTTTLNAKTAHYGDKFEGLLVESYELDGKALPEGTLFKGTVKSARKSMPFGLPGYVVLEIDEAQLPSGAVHHFDHGASAPISHRVVNPKAQTRKKMLKDNIPFTAISTATSVPLRYAAGMNPWTIVPIAIGSRLALGVGMHLNNKNPQNNMVQNQPAATPTIAKVGQGILQGSGLQGAYYFMTASPEPELSQGTIIPLHFKAHDMAALFSAVEPTAQAKPEPDAAKSDVTKTGARAEDAVSQPSGMSTPTLGAQPDPKQPEQATHHPDESKADESKVDETKAQPSGK